MSGQHIFTQYLTAFLIVKKNGEIMSNIFLLILSSTSVKRKKGREKRDKLGHWHWHIHTSIYFMLYFI